MIVRPIKTKKVVAGSGDIFNLLNEFLPKIPENSIVAITSKVVAICEGRVEEIGSTDKAALVLRESEYFLPPAIDSPHKHHFTIAENIIVASAGIDESNGNGKYVLWPEKPQKSANQIRSYIKSRFKLKNVGIIITDSIIAPLRRGTTGVGLAYSGFLPTNDYIGKPDLFGKKLVVTKSNLVDALATAAVLVMGEGAEQTPIALIEDLPFVEFQGRNPNAKELADLKVSIEEDLFAPFLNNVNWRKGNRPKNR